jgi:hypothetical protein
MAGPSGGYGGDAFDDGQVGDDWELGQIYVWSGDWINGIIPVWRPHGSRETVGQDWWQGAQHGGRGDPLSDLGDFRDPLVVGLDPDEYVIRMEGTYGLYVNQLKFHSNFGREWSYGNVAGPRQFDYNHGYGLDGYEILTFHGASGIYLDSLGVHYRQRF